MHSHDRQGFKTVLKLYIGVEWDELGRDLGSLDAKESVAMDDNDITHDPLVSPLYPACSQTSSGTSFGNATGFDD